MRYSEMPSPIPCPIGETLPLDRISPRPTLRHTQEHASLEALAESIRRFGLMRPVTVRRTAQGRYVIVSGNRRLMACRMLGVTSISARVLRDDARWQPADCLLDALLMHRMHYLEEAEALRALREQHRLSWEELSGMLGEKTAVLAAQASLAGYPDELKALLMEEGVPMGIALTLLRLPEEETRIRVARMIVREKLCVRDAALLVSAELRRATKEQGAIREDSFEKNKVYNGNERAATVGGRRMVQVIRDQRLYLNAIRDIAKQMQTAGFPATLTERRVEGQMEMVIRTPARRRRMERYQSE